MNIVYKKSKITNNNCIIYLSIDMNIIQMNQLFAEKIILNFNKKKKMS